MCRKYFFLLIPAILWWSVSYCQAQQSEQTQQGATDTATQTPDTPNAAKPSPFQHTIQPSFGVTITTISSANDDKLSAEWVASLNANFFYDGEPWQLGASLYAKYGQENFDSSRPQVTQDELIASITPSRTIWAGPKIRLFLETAAQTQMADGIVDDSAHTKFLDPLLVYQSLFVGRRFSDAAEDGSWQYDLTAGVGYALQETLARDFILQQNRNVVVTQQNPLSGIQNEITLESGYSVIVNFNLQETIDQNLQFTTSWKTVAINRLAEPSLPAASTFLEDASVTSLLLIGFQYKFISFDYSGNLTYDRNVSLRRTIEQSLVFGFKATF